MCTKNQEPETYGCAAPSLTGFAFDFVLIGYFNTQLFATVRPSARTHQWAGDGPETIWNQYPTGPLGAKNFDKVEQYRQGVVFVFRASGHLYRMDWYLLFNTLSMPAR